MPDANSRTLSFADAITEATTEAMREDESVILYGLGVNDPGRVFGTTRGLLEEFGPSRVFETPTAENAMTGIAVGAALGGLRPIVTHQRFDFFLLAMDQLVNSAAKCCESAAEPPLPQINTVPPLFKQLQINLAAS